jgi:hypothetical protein
MDLFASGDFDPRDQGADPRVVDMKGPSRMPCSIDPAFMPSASTVATTASSASRSGSNPVLMSMACGCRSEWTTSR